MINDVMETGKTLYSWGFVDEKVGKYVVLPNDQKQEDFRTVLVDRENPFDKNGNGELEEFLEAMDTFFDGDIAFVFIDENDFSNTGVSAALKGNVPIVVNCGPVAPLGFDTEDLRDKIELPKHVNPEDALFFVFTNGPEEDDILDWVVFYPVE